MDAPKRIWACENGQWVAEWFNPPLGAQYIRADIAADARAEALKEAADVASTMGCQAVAFAILALIPETQP